MKHQLKSKVYIPDPSRERCVRTDNFCAYPDPHRHGFACSDTCTECGGK